jgi:hypothetical protein
MTDQRRSTLRRQVNSLGMRDGEAQESKMFATIGKCICIWLIWKYAELLINHWEVLLVLIAWLIAPDIAKKAITMRFGGQGGYTERSESSSSSTVTKKVDNPDDK